MPARSESWQVRSTTPGVLDPLRDVLDAQSEPHEGLEPKDNVFSFVESSGRGVRRLPSIHFGNGLIYSDRHRTKVADRLVSTVRTAVDALAHPTYMATPCRYAGSLGLYAREIFNRSRFRRDLVRLGMEFADDPFVRYEGGSTFSSKEWGTFDLAFVVVSGQEEDLTQLIAVPRTSIIVVLAQMRLGAMKPEELREIVEMSSSVRGLAAGDPATILDALQTA